MQVYAEIIKISVGADLVRDNVSPAVIAHEMRSYKATLSMV
jgi:hypothetical protein